MNKKEWLRILQRVQEGDLTPEEVVVSMQTEPFKDLGYAKTDNHRGIRQGAQKVIYGEGKTLEQIRGIAQSMAEQDHTNILITRLSNQAADVLAQQFDFIYHPLPRLGVVNPTCNKESVGEIVVASGGTSDQSVSEEAALTAELLGSRVTRLYDVGVSGIHRLLAQMDVLARARVVVVVAGMEGALASVIGGLVSCPVIAVPTSVGYGANFKGIAALLAMLNSCASGVSVVNIDNGFGAGFLADKINQMEGVK